MEYKKMREQIKNVENIKDEKELKKYLEEQKIFNKIGNILKGKETITKSDIVKAIEKIHNYKYDINV